jgi:serine/threonine-protein kinase Chk2
MKEIKTLSSDPETVNEVGLMLAAEHPNIVRVHEVYEEPGRPLVLVMELVEPQEQYRGEPPDLMTILTNEGPISMDKLAKVLYQTAAGINYLNKELGAFHRDLKPDNILIGKEGWDRIRVADFGHGRIVGGEIDGAAVGTMNKGTPGYSAPETISDTAEYGMYNQQCDVWSLGVIIYMCASGAPPFPIAAHLANTARSRTLKGEFKPMEGPKWARVPEDVKALIRSMLVVDPARRVTMEAILQNPWVKRNAGVP